jgi:hypothetical protein
MTRSTRSSFKSSLKRITLPVKSRVCKRAPSTSVQGNRCRGHQALQSAGRGDVHALQRSLRRARRQDRVVEGEAPKRIVMIAFDSMEQAQAWYDSPAYRAIRPIRHKSATPRVYIVEGAPEARSQLSGPPTRCARLSRPMIFTSRHSGRMASRPARRYGSGRWRSTATSMWAATTDRRRGYQAARRQKAGSHGGRRDTRRSLRTGRGNDQRPRE